MIRRVLLLAVAVPAACAALGGAVLFAAGVWVARMVERGEWAAVDTGGLVTAP